MTEVKKRLMPKGPENTLTDIGAISYLLAKEGEIMNGTIRARGKCPVCQSRFTELKKLDFLCPEHQTTPKRYFVDFYYGSQRLRLFSDRYGQILDSYQRAANLLAQVNSEIKNHTFDPSHYLVSVRKFLSVIITVVYV